MERLYKMIKLFVYGTLRKGGRFDMFLDTAKYIGEATAKGFQLFTNGDYPMIVPGDGVVHGEVYEIDEKTHEFMDIMDLEYGYKSETIDVLVDGKKDTALAFIGDNELHSRVWHMVEDGVFKE